MSKYILFEKKNSTFPNGPFLLPVNFLIYIVSHLFELRYLVQKAVLKTWNYTNVLKYVSFDF